MLTVGDLRYHTSGESFDVLRCAHCEILVTTKDSDFFDPVASYPADYGAFVTKAPRPRRLQRLRIAERLRSLTRPTYVASDRLAWTRKLDLKAGDRVLDIGCGTGETGELLSRLTGCQVVGVEPNPQAAQIARDRGQEVHQGTLESFDDTVSFEAEPFEVVLLIHVLEHLTNPLASLRRIHGWLQPTGRLVIALPNAGSWERRIFGPHWDGWDIPCHVHHFNPPSLRYLLRAAGFAVEDFSYEWYSLFSRSLANRLHPQLPVSERARKYRVPLLEAGWGLAQSVLRRSSALQVIAIKNPENDDT